MRIVRTGGWAIALVVLALVAGVVVPRPLFPEPGHAAGTPRGVLLLSNPIHTDIALPADADVLARFGFLARDGLPLDLEGVMWIVVGWGGRAFYLETPAWADLRAGPLVRAFTVDRSVMHVELAGEIGAAEPNVLALDLPPAAFEALLDGVLASFSRGGDGEAMPIPGSGYGAYDLFYEAEGWFNAVVGCNLWTAAMLRQAGLRTGWWTPLPPLLTGSLRLHNALPGP